MPRRTILSGMPLATLQSNLATMQQAYVDISSGAKGETYSYSSGEGSRAVTYTRANLTSLESAIRLVQDQIAIETGACNRNGPMTPIFG